MSGNKTVKFNTREKVLSEDVNKAQALGNRGLMEVARHLFSTLHNGKEDVQYVTTGAPLRALVLSGLCVLPQMASFDLYISAGAACTTETQVDPNNSPLCFAELTSNAATPGALVLSPNPAGSVRVDVVEFSRVDETFAIENRDIYNESTRVFDAVSVPKIVGSRLVFRVRQGVPGAGYPGHASGWCPLAIACHAPGSTTNDNVEFFDVRPLLSDLDSLVHRTRGANPGYDYEWLESSYSGNLSDLSGRVEARVNGRRVGGLLGSEDEDAAVFSIQAVSGKAGGFVVPGATFVATLYMLFPHDLPRWSRYTSPASGYRLPSNFSGIPCVSTAVPDQFGCSETNILPPTSFGLLTATTGYMFGMTCTTPAEFVAGGTTTTMHKKIFIDPNGNLADAGYAWSASSMPVPKPAKFIDVAWQSSVAGIASGKVLGLTRTFADRSEFQAKKSTGGDLSFSTFYPRVPTPLAPSGAQALFKSVSAENLTDATAIAPVYTDLIYPAAIQF